MHHKEAEKKQDPQIGAERLLGAADSPATICGRTGNKGNSLYAALVFHSVRKLVFVVKALCFIFFNHHAGYEICRR